MNQSERDDSQIALSIATRAAIYVAIFFVTISIAVTYMSPGFYASLFEIVGRVVAIIVALTLAHPRIVEAKDLQNPEAVPFLSTIFFYGITLLLVYLGQMGYVLFHLIAAPASSIIDQIEFLLGISSFSGMAIVTAFLSAHIPYVVYFLILKLRIRAYMQ
jgi:uncharacterized membrane protein YqjE